MNLLRTVTLDRANRKKDKSVSLTFITQTEQSSEQFVEIDKMLGDSGVLYFKPSGNLTTEEVKELDNVEVENEGKSKAQRLRGMLFVAWKQSQQHDTFQEFYSTYMERIIEHYKSKLEQE